ncbi:M48 family metallopeptidase [Pseudomarimonas salicorniae]|uniref:M48 family metallopeptidase n=1 Tax=Pseudomarimonas salicorniae TaxID=2933270 RepID=A0ABT0GD93_9GAMM|nr:M48 family metallopeptidase [Lysobacter sp. CAU 1642]MCK7592154.1 M48 family metallopeptidase [Lysobacter sp. CAU 1642]
MTGNFFQRQESARRATRRLVMLFAAAIVAVVAAVSAVVLLCLALMDRDGVLAAGGAAGWLAGQGEVLLGVAVAVLLLILAASWYRSRSLRRGGAEVARLLGGREVQADCMDPHDRRLRNVVEELAIAACLPVPAIFVLDKEPAINAFAAGYSPSDAAVAVTRGALEKLNRDELQGVVAHEFSHILNGDMRLNMRLLGLLFGIVVIGVLGRQLLHVGRGNSRNAAPLVVGGLGLLVVGAVGVFFARLIKAGIARSREVLADASAVQFTRQSAGLAGALKKIAGLAEGSGLQNAHAEEVSHMLFGEWRGYSSWFATHPPLVERIRVLDPAFNDSRLAELSQRWDAQPPSGLDEDVTLGLAGDASIGAVNVLPKADSQLRPVPGTTAARIAQPIGDDTRRASGLHRLMPEALTDAARDAQRAAAVLLALLLDRDRAIRARQLAEVAVVLDEDAADRVSEYLPHCESLHPSLRLPMAALTFPALRRQSREALMDLVKCAQRLVHIDGKVSLFDYCLSKMLQTQVVEALEPARYRAAGKRKLADCKPALSDLFAVLVSYGYDDPEPMRRAYIAGLLAVLPSERFEFAPPRQWIPAMDKALAELDRLDPHGKQLLIEGMVVAISHDGRISVDESELIRAVCACLHCPLPPVVEQRARPRHQADRH